MDGKNRSLEERIDSFCLMDDEFLSEVFDNQPNLVEFLLHILLERDDLHVTEAKTQVEYKSATSRSVRLDIRAEDSTGKIYDIEIQRNDQGAGVRRARVYSSMIDRTLLEKGDSFDAIPDTYVIFITERDLYGLGLPLYHIRRTVDELNHEDFGDGTHILYVNGNYREEAHPIGRLMRDFHCKRAEEMHYPLLADRVQYFKETEGGRTQMSRIGEEIAREAAEKAAFETKKENARRMLNRGKLTLEEIAEYSGLPLEMVKELAGQKTA